MEVDQRVAVLLGGERGRRPSANAFLASWSPDRRARACRETIGHRAEPSLASAVARVRLGRRRAPPGSSHPLLERRGRRLARPSSTALRRKLLPRPADSRPGGCGRDEKPKRRSRLGTVTRCAHNPYLATSLAGLRGWAVQASRALRATCAALAAGPGESSGARAFCAAHELATVRSLPEKWGRPREKGLKSAGPLGVGAAATRNRARACRAAPRVRRRTTLSHGGRTLTGDRERARTTRLPVWKWAGGPW